MISSADQDGYEALQRGSEYYDLAMSFTEASDHAERIACFQEAERCYLQAAEKGNLVAWMCLGYVYSYDRCEGKYEPLPGQAPGEPYPRERRAFECYRVAAEAGFAEACYKLGDMLQKGVGCNPDAVEAFRWYKQSSELSDGTPPAVWGSAALRLADAYENGLGCRQSFEQALEWYRRAVVGLEIAVRDGDWFYERVLVRARNGEKRTRQELDPMS